MLYADTNALVRVYLELDTSGEAERILFDHVALESEPVPVPSLLLCEFSNALGRLVFENSRGGQWRISKELAGAAWSTFEEHLDGGILFSRHIITSNDVESLFIETSQRYTAREGFRTYDILHICFARALGCEKFFSYDRKAVKLAELEGLTVVN